MAPVSSSLVILCFFLQAANSLRNLSEVTYHFTPCGSVGRNGPTITECREAYTKVNSPIVKREDTLFEFSSSGEDIFVGTQGFRIPRTGLYNVTVAGAAGGRGICSYTQGYGLLWKGQVSLSSEQDLLVLVGQKGLEPCDITRVDNPLCDNPPTNLNESVACFDDWDEWLKETQTSSSAYHTKFYSGGASGGGASLLRLRNRTSNIFNTFPLIIAGGGGGTGSLTSTRSMVLLDYYMLEANATDNSSDELDDDKLYQSYINAKNTRTDLFNRTGVRGYIQPGIVGLRPGAGAGYLALQGVTDADGSPLSTIDNVAVGGFDCTRQFINSQVQTLYNTLHGGFGGGGGQCEGGGAGAGFTGGAVLGNTDFGTPGGGGHYVSYSDSPTNNVTEFEFAFNARKDGYVDIIHANCECMYECEIYEDIQGFECKCPNGTEFQLAPNEMDCFISVEIETENIPMDIFEIDNFQLTFLKFNKSVGLFSVDTPAMVTQTTVDDSLVNHTNLNSTPPNTDIACVMIFLDGDGNIVLKTNVLREEQGNFNRLSDYTTNELGTSKFLDNAVAVNGAILLSNHHKCSLEETFLRVNASMEYPDQNQYVFGNLNYTSLTQFANILLRRTKEGDSTSTGTANSATTASLPTNFVLANPEIVIIISLAGLVVTMTTIMLCVYFCLYRNKRKRKKRILSGDRRMTASVQNFYGELAKGRRSKSGDVDSSMVPNQLYYRYSVGQLPNDSRNRTESDRPQLGRHVSYEAIDYFNPPRRSLTNNMETKGRRGITLSSRSFVPKFGVDAPDHDFTVYNLNRNLESDEWEYPRSKLTYMKEIGEGQFGKVLLMRAQGIADYSAKIPVAVKTLSSSNSELLQKFLQEANLMKKFSHPNIVSLLGTSVSDVDEDNAPLLILEYMPFGDLQSFLRKHKNEDKEDTIIGVAHFFSFARDVAEGLAFLASKKYVHRDIAARNCLVGTGLTIKIADFGLSRGVYDRDHYRCAGKAMLPIKWLSPEALLFGIFATASDVWAYGVLLWEITTFGELPLTDLKVEDIVQLAEKGRLHHSRPDNCPDLMNQVMERCHAHEPKQRVSLNEIRRLFSKENTLQFCNEEISNENVNEIAESSHSSIQRLCTLD